MTAFEKKIVLTGWVLLSVVAIAGGAIFLYQRANRMPTLSTPTSYPYPVSTWSHLSTQTVVVQPGSGSIAYDMPPGDSRIRKIVVTAKSPVNLSWIPSEFKAQMVSDPVTTSKLNIFYCLNAHVLKTEFQCIPPPRATGYSLVIIDERSAGNILAGTFAAALGVKGVADDQLVRNDVQIDIWVWACERNCSTEHSLPVPG